jgi:hypothetical protein
MRVRVQGAHRGAGHCELGSVALHTIDEGQHEVLPRCHKGLAVGGLEVEGHVDLAVVVRDLRGVGGTKISDLGYMSAALRLSKLGRGQGFGF